MSITRGSVAEPTQQKERLKDFLVYRVNETDGHYEIAGESALEIEARRFAGLMAAVGCAEDAGGHYEAWRVSDPVLLFTTSRIHDDQ